MPFLRKHSQIHSKNTFCNYLRISFFSLRLVHTFSSWTHTLLTPFSGVLFIFGRNNEKNADQEKCFLFFGVRMDTTSQHFFSHTNFICQCNHLIILLRPFFVDVQIIAITERKMQIKKICFLFAFRHAYFFDVDNTSHLLCV